MAPEDSHKIQEHIIEDTPQPFETLEGKEDTLQPEDVSSNSRIAKNAMMLYIRMFLTMIVGLYTSRVVLDVLGVEDYGIYGVVGGVVVMLTFINASMSGATSRFLAFELASGNQKRLVDTFSSALIAHIGIAVVIVVLAETVGLWFLTHKLIIPESRMTAAHWVYQCTIISAILNITQVPYNAAIIAHERMDVYAYVEILKVSLKLLIVYLLSIGDFDKLILYAVLVLAVTAIVLIVYRIYCIRSFQEAHFHFIWDKTILKPLISFSGWNLFGNFGSVFLRQGTNFVVNFFFGVVMNAAITLGFTVANLVNQFASNVMMAFRPQIIKYYSQGEKEKMKDLTILAINVIMFIYCLVAIPVFVEAENLLSIWLVEVPDYSVLFCRLLLISIFFETIRYILIIDIHATGNARLVSLFSGMFFIILPFLTYLLFAFGFCVQTAVILIILANAFLCLINVFLVEKYTHVKMSPIFVSISKVVLISAVSLLLTFWVKKMMPLSYVYIIINSLIGVSIVGLLYFLFCFTPNQRKSALIFVKNKIRLR